jgi:8-oxo-dGTP pyrophosphatase MutT (NUDIX family)
VDAGEAPVTAAAREFREETGIVLAKSRLQPVLDARDYDGRHYFTVRLRTASVAVSCQFQKERSYVRMSSTVFSSQQARKLFLWPGDADVHTRTLRPIYFTISIGT